MALLAHLYSHIRGSQEDIATYSLQYLLSASRELNRAYTKLIADAFSSNLPDSLNYTCQVTGEKQERPDISGTDSKGKEVLLCEAKFYAGLTDNQPNAYLDRLVKEKGTGLVFLCPEMRKHALWSNLLQLVSDRFVEEITDFCVSVDGVKMSILTWSEVLATLRRVASSMDVEYLSDVEQLAGFCREMDTDAFVPFSPEDLGSNVAKREERYFQIIDSLTDCLYSDKSMNPSVKGMKATAYRKGYGRGIEICGYRLSLYYSRDLWTDQGTCDTPFWVGFRVGSEWKQDDFILRAFQGISDLEKGKLWGFTFLALHPKLYGTLDEVVADLKVQIIKYTDMLDQERNKE